VKDAAANPSTAYIALGANLGDRQANLHQAIDLLNAAPGVEVIRVSSFLENPSVGGPADAPAFLNGAAEVRTSLSPQELLGVLLEIERRLGRVRQRKNEPRPIDLDLLLYGDRILNDPDLILPHPLMHQRRFVLKPLGEIAPDAVHPTLRLTIRQLAEHLGS
jgi:2-amino-4-hydroxy-6-hydroxymethyldihydropteridine diphosphokinase